MPINIQAQVAYKGKSYSTKFIPLKKEGTVYTGSFTPKDSIPLLVFGIVDADKSNR